MNKEELIKKYALEVIAEYGFERTKVQSIADKAKIAVGTIYNYFKNKEEILNYIFECNFNKVTDLINKIEANDESELEKIQEILELQYEQLMSNPNIVKVLIQDGMRPSEYSNDIMKMSGGIIEKLVKIIDEGKINNVIKEVDSYLFAFLILNSITSAVYFIQQYKLVENNENTRTQLISYLMYYTTLYINFRKSRFN